ncbi:MAG TPA: tetratricopeptide repeat protein [Chitinophagaceae bacterium]
MRIHKVALLLIGIVLSVTKLFPQQAAAVDSIKSSLAGAKTPEEKVFWLDNLSRTLMNVNLPQAEEYGKQLITFAEETRDRKLMVKAYMSNGERCGYFAGQKVHMNKSIEYYNKALEIAKQNKMEEKVGEIQLRLTSIYLIGSDREKALQNINQAFSLISTLKNDSLLAESHNLYGMVYQARNEKTLALRHFLNALRIAEDKNNTNVLRNSYVHLSNFYTRIEDHDKAIDYYMKAYKLLDKMKEKNVPYQRCIDINMLGNLFANKKNYDIAITYFERSIRMADSLKFTTLKIPGSISLINQYLRIDQPQKALDYFNSAAGENMKKFMIGFGLSSVIDQSYGYIYTELGRFDSAKYRFIRAIPYFENNTNASNKISFYLQVANMYKKVGDKAKAIEYFQKVKEMSENNGSLEGIRTAAKQLDSLYMATGDYKQASLYNSVYYKYKDSIEKLNKENELAQIEAFDEQQRQERILAEKEEAKEKRNRIQYMAITIAIGVLFIALVMMGWFKVSANTIRAIGFISFLVFFEFLFLIFKKNIYGLTNGEPLYDLALMIGLAAILVPLHHKLEHRVIHFLTSHHMLKLRGIFSGKGEENS